MKDIRVYLDYHATTPIDDRVYTAMQPYLREHFGNPSSRFHSFGWKTQEAVDYARKSIAHHLHASPREIVFTSGSTESNNTAIRGVMEKNRERGNHIITCVTEHKSVLAVCEYLEQHGFDVTYLPVDRDGLLDLNRLQEAITNSTVLVTLMTVNNEIGVIHPIEEIGKITRDRGVLFHTDATQAIGKMNVNVDEAGIDLLSLTGHKIYGPKGIGVLYIRQSNPKVEIEPMIIGGGQEHNLRAGTSNVPGIVGLAKAIELCEEFMIDEVARTRQLRDRLLSGLQDNLTDISINGSMEYRVSNNLNVSFHGIEAQALLMVLDDIALSLGSACLGQKIEPSHVLRALHIPEDDMYASVRFGLGRFTTEDEISYAVRRITETVSMLRSQRSSHKKIRPITAK